jgi:DnaJ homolog subfamily C member 28
MDKWEPLVDRLIRESMDRGEFDDLAGSGEPIDLSENPFESPEIRTAHRLLRNAGFAPAWIEERKDIENEFQNCYTVLTRARELYCRGKDGTKSPQWQRAIKEFRERVEELNQRIRLYNLKSPATSLHRRIIDVDSLVTELEEGTSNV